MYLRCWMVLALHQWLHLTGYVQEEIITCLSAILRLVKNHLTCPAEVRAKDDWLPAHTFLMMNPCSASITLGRYTRLVSPWPSLPASVSHNINIKSVFHVLPGLFLYLLHCKNSRWKCKIAGFKLSTFNLLTYHCPLLQRTTQSFHPEPQQWCGNCRTPPAQHHWCPSLMWACSYSDYHCDLHKGETAQRRLLTI